MDQDYRFMETVTEGDLRVFLSKPPFGLHNVPEDNILCFMDAVTHSTYAHESEDRGEKCRSYERLEYLGDAVMEFLVIERLYLNTTLDVEEMNRRKEMYVKNDSLFHDVVSQIGDPRRIIRVSDSNWENFGPEGQSSVIADVAEALIGAEFRCYGIDSARQIVYSTVMKDFCPEAVREDSVISDPVMRSRVRSFIEDMDPLCEDRHLKENELDLFCEALTHPYYSNEKGDVRGNQRMILLGSAILQLMVSCYDFEHYPDAAEGKLTDMKQRAISHKNIYTYLRRSGIDVSEGIIASTSGPFEPGIRADISDKMESETFKAIIAAYYLLFGPEDTEELVSKVIFAYKPVCDGYAE